MSDSKDKVASAPLETHPLDEVVGVFESQPLWDELMDEVMKIRQQDQTKASRRVRRVTQKVSS